MLWVLLWLAGTGDIGICVRKGGGRERGNTGSRLCRLRVQ